MSDSASAPSDLDARLAVALAPHLVLVRLLGAGGMGSVFEARDPALRRTVAVKVLAPDLAADPAARARFEREAQAVAGLSHPNVVPVYSVGELADGTPFFVMQHVIGRSMAARVEEEGPLEVAEARRVLGEVAAALAAAHAKGIIHRDIKPANILFDEDSGRALVSDFGIAAVIPRGDRGEVSRLTQTGMVVGTPQYMSLEQLLNEPVGDKTDVYALGLLAYELLTGHAAFAATTPQELIAAHLRDTPRPLQELRDDVDAELGSLVARCLEKNPVKRPSADEVARRLAPGGGVLLEWPPPGLAPLHHGLPAAARRFWLGSVLALGAVLPLMLAGTRLASALTSGALLLLVLLGAAGAAALAGAARATLRLGRSVSRAVRAGFGWLTVLETIADRRGDTGSLIAGTHEWSAVPAAHRSALRRARLTRELTLFAGGVLPLPLVALVVIAGSAGLVGAGATWVAPAVALACLLVALALERFERRAAAPTRRRAERERPAPDLARLSAAWNQTFETVRQEQALGRGPAGRSALGWLGAGTLAALMVLVIIVVAEITFIGALGPAVWLAIVPKFANTSERLAQAEALRPFALPPDPSITPLEAGRAAFALQGGRRDTTGLFVELPVAGVPPQPWNEAMPDSLFAGYRHNGLPSAPKWTVIDSARRGFTPAEIAWLETTTHHPAWRPYRQVARARAVDFLGGRFALPFPSDASPWAMPIASFAGTKAYAYATSSRAAYYLARGRRDSAEVAVREVLSVGFRFIDDSPFLIDALIGAVLVGIARDDLIRLYRVTGNPAGARLQARIDSIRIAQEEPDTSVAARAAASVDWSDPRAVRRELIGVTRNPARVRGLRMSVLLTLGMAPCTNAQELVFGPADDIRQAFDYARRNLARFPAESALVDVFFTASERLPRDRPLGLGQRMVVRAADLAGALLHNRRLPGCARALLMLGGAF